MTSSTESLLRLTFAKGHGYFPMLTQQTLIMTIRRLSGCGHLKFSGIPLINGQTDARGAI